MKNPIINVKNKMGEVKGRTLLIVIAVIILFIIVAFFTFRKTEEAQISGTQGMNPRTATVKVPEIESTLGAGHVSDEAYIALQQRANEQKAQEAIQKGTSAVATVTSNQFVPELTVPESNVASAVPQTRKNEQLAQYQRVYEQQMQREQQREAELRREQETEKLTANQEAYESLMQAQLKNLMGQWKTPTQTYVRNEAEGQPLPQPAAPTIPPLYKAGDVIFGIMETSVNSDEPGPVMAKVVSGPLTGAKLLGSFRRVEDQVFLEFSLLNAPNITSSLPVKAVAIDPETARTALSSDVDHHRLLRYSTLFASAFLQGMGDAVLAGIQPDFSVDGDVFTVNSVSVGTRDQVIVGLGEVGRKAGEKFDKYFDIPPTVTLDSGTAVGLLFLQDFSLQASGTGPVQVVETNAPQLPANSVYIETPEISPASTTADMHTTNTVTRP